MAETAWGAGSRGCFHNYYDEVHYKMTNDTVFVADTFISTRYENKVRDFVRKINKTDLLSVLADVNLNPHDIPSLKDFSITESDKNSYFSMVDKLPNNKRLDFYHGRKKINKDFYCSIPDILDTLNNSVLESVLKQKESLTSSTTNWFDIKIVNKRDDTLIIKREYDIDNLPWCLPWRVEYKGQYFSCYNIGLSRFINSCIPQDFFGKQGFNNSQLLMAIADYLWSRRE